MIGSTTFGLLACGMTMVLVDGEIDLSVGSQEALTSVLMATLAPKSLAFTIVQFLAVTVGIGFQRRSAGENGMPSLCTHPEHHGYCAFHGSGYRQRSACVRYSQVIHRHFQRHGGTRAPGGLHFVTIYLLTWFFLKYTTPNGSIYAVGSNSESARLSGVNVDRIKLATYVISGFMAGLTTCSTPSTLPSVCPMAPWITKPKPSPQQLSAEPVSLAAKARCSTP